MDDYPAVSDIRDEVIILMESNWNELDPTEDGLYQAMLNAVHKILEKEVAYTQQQTDTVSLETEAPTDAMDQAEAAAGEEAGEFFQPDEVLHIEDLIPDTDMETPEQLAETEALDTCYQLLGDLPTQWRRAMILVYREQINPAAVATHIMGLTEEELETILAYAQAFMQAHLREAGRGDFSPSLLLGKYQRPWR